MLNAAQWPAIAAKYPWKPLDNGNIRSTVASLSYAALFEPKAYQGGEAKPGDKNEPRYGVTLLLPKGDTAAELVKALHGVIRQQFGDKCTISEPSGGAKPTVRVDYVEGGKPARANLNWPLVDQGEVLSDGYVPGSLYVAAYSYDKPAVVDAKRNPIADKQAVYSGCYAFATVRPYWAKGYKRLAVGLQGVQFLADGERFGGGAPAVEEQFDDVAADFGAIGAEAAANMSADDLLG